MGSSYYITYGGNRVTFPGTPGPVAWAEPMVDVNLSMDKSWLKMRFVDSTGGETSMEVGSGLSASASASVPRNSTAYWTANGYQGYESSRQHVTAFLASGFDGVSAYTSVTTAFYTNPSVSSYGSARLTASDTASAHISNAVAYKAVYGEGSQTYSSTISASSWAGIYCPTFTHGIGRVMWIPYGAKIVFSAAASAYKTYHVQDNLTALSGYAITYNHTGPGTRSTVSGYMNSAYSFRLGGGRTKNVYATGTAYHLATGSAVSAATWRAYTIVTGFSSNLNNNSATGSFINGSANANKINGFTPRKELGQLKNSAGTWTVISGSNSLYVWKYVQTFSSMSGTMSGNYSAVRAKGGTGNATATATICGYNTANGSYSLKQGTFAYPTASAKTSTNIQTVSTTSTGASSDLISVCNMFQCAGATNANLWVNCRGAWTASGVVM